MQCRCALRQYSRKLSKQLREGAAAVVEHARYVEAFEKIGGVVLPVLKMAWAQTWPCGRCTMSFQTKANLHSHMSRKHGIRAELSCVGGTQCAKFGREFWATSRLKDHVRQGNSCLAFVMFPLIWVRRLHLSRLVTANRGLGNLLSKGKGLNHSGPAWI